MGICTLVSTMEKVIPKKGEIAFLDRSWYTRALTEPVMGYCSEKQYRDFMNQVLSWEQNLIDSGVEIIKFYFSLSKDQQKRRMKARKHSELKYWKLSLMMSVSSPNGMHLHYTKNKCLKKLLPIFLMDCNQR